VDNKKPVDDEETSPAEDVKPVVPSFSDVKESDWFAPAMNFMKEKGIMIGYENSVRPNDAVTRGELAKIVVTAFALTSDKTGTSFSDGSGAWWNSFAETAAACGVVNGLGDGRFGGDEIINREMLAVMIDRAITAKNIELYDQNSGTSFNDESYISDYAKAAIERLSKKGIIKGVGEGVFAPSLSVTRAEAAQIVYNVLKQL
jgi:endo-1,4-beta-xylanase